VPSLCDALVDRFPGIIHEERLRLVEMSVATCFDPSFHQPAIMMQMCLFQMLALNFA